MYSSEIYQCATNLFPIQIRVVIAKSSRHMAAFPTLSFSLMIKYLFQISHYITEKQKQNMALNLDNVYLCVHHSLESWESDVQHKIK